MHGRQLGQSSRRQAVANSRRGQVDDLHRVTADGQASQEPPGAGLNQNFQSGGFRFKHTGVVVAEQPQSPGKHLYALVGGNRLRLGPTRRRNGRLGVQATRDPMQVETGRHAQNRLHGHTGLGRSHAIQQAEAVNVADGKRGFDARLQPLVYRDKTAFGQA